MSAEIALVFAVAFVAVAVTIAGHASLRTKAGVALFVIGAAIACAFALPSPVASALPASRPLPAPASSYVSSNACKSCHPSEHASWSSTFHRTMTQDASAQTVLAPLDGKPIAIESNRTVTLTRRAPDEAWATLPDPDLVAKDPRAIATAPEVTRRIVLTTGSHLEQTYWVDGARRGELRIVPIVWIIGEKRAIARRDAFLTPPEARAPGAPGSSPLGPARWNSNCIACHSVAGEPRHDESRDAFDTRAAELGIACEACHGPGQAHVEAHREPLSRMVQNTRNARTPDPTIVLPSRLSPEKSAAVCGQCHAYAFPKNESEFWRSGYAKSFRAGDTLDASRTVLARSLAHAPEIDAPADALFWEGGTIRVGGREYNGLVLSPCYLRGDGERTMTCLSCHAMHEGDPDKQIAPAKSGDHACISCHAATPEHSHHREGSPGRACVSCHMPKTSYALFRATRSHRITSPSVSRALETGEPNACALCHLDRPISFVQDAMKDWYRGPDVALAEEDRTVAQGLLLALRGDAAVRVLVADALGSSDLRAASIAPYEKTITRELTIDPWAAVRTVAQRSDANARPFSVDSLDERARAALLLLPDGTPDLARRKSLLAARDDRAITIAE